MADRVRTDDLPRIPADRIGLGFEAYSMALFSPQSDWMLFGQWQQIQKQDQVAENEEVSLGYDLLTLGMTYQLLLAKSEYRIDLKLIMYWMKKFVNIPPSLKNKCLSLAEILVWHSGLNFSG
jgi:hypothetical protein